MEAGRSAAGVGGRKEASTGTGSGVVADGVGVTGNDEGIGGDACSGDAEVDRAHAEARRSNGRACTRMRNGATLDGKAGRSKRGVGRSHGIAGPDDRGPRGCDGKASRRHG